VLSAVILGFALGLRHAFDADHVAAVSALLARHRNPWTASWVGASWGAGHAATLLAVGTLAILFRVALPGDLQQAAELGVGALLVVLGIANLAAAGRPAVPAAEPVSLGPVLARSGAIGLAHGLAGSGALAILATAAMPTPTAAVAYLAVFGLGSVVGMVGFSLALGAPAAQMSRRAGFRRPLAAATGALSVLCGVWLVFRTGLPEGWLA
jgi:high-affinity nickel-transport protein